MNVSFGHLSISAFVEQPLGYLFLPVEPASQTGDQDRLDWADLEKQIGRLVELIQMVFVRWRPSPLWSI